MKKFGVIHQSENWISGPATPRFDSLKEAQKYVKDFRGSKAHAKDVAEIVEIVSTHGAAIADQTQDSVLYGLKERK
jgi:hypothetical protein